MRTLLVTCFALAVASFLAADSPNPDDTIGKEYWSALDAKAKPAFLMGFRYATGLTTFDSPKRSLTLHSNFIPEMVVLMDKFYADAANQHVHLRDAIHVCLMQHAHRPEDEIAPVLKAAREEFFKQLQ